jgi:hypothetical protein
VVLVLYFADASGFAGAEKRGDVVSLAAGVRACDLSSAKFVADFEGEADGSLHCGLDLRRSRVSQSAGWGGVLGESGGGGVPVALDRVVEESMKGKGSLSWRSPTLDSMLGAVREYQRPPVLPHELCHELTSDMSDSGELYFIYTSGTTGTPKAVIGRCAALDCYLASPAFRRFVGDRVLLCSATTWDPSISDVFGTLTQGATLILEPRARLMSDLVGCIDDNKVSHVLGTPALWRLAMGNHELAHRRAVATRGGVGGGGGGEFLPTLRVLQLGGESWRAAEV